MTASTPIAIMVERMLAAGMAADVVVAAVEAQELNSRSHSKELVLLNNSTKRGTRLSVQWRPTFEGLDYARGLGMSQHLIELEVEKFRNYWTAKTGANATKRDWEATWRNWIITAMEGRHGRNSAAHATAGHQPAGADAILSGMGRLAARFSKI